MHSLLEVLTILLNLQKTGASLYYSYSAFSLYFATEKCSSLSIHSWKTFNIAHTLRRSLNVVMFRYLRALYETNNNQKSSKNQFPILTFQENRTKKSSHGQTDKNDSVSKNRKVNHNFLHEICASSSYRNFKLFIEYEDF